MRRLLAPTFIIMSLALVGCGSSSVSGDTVAEQVSTQLGEQVGREPDNVDCPEDLDAEVGATTRCTLDDGGTEYGVDVEVTSVDGSEVAFDIAVDETPTE